MVVNAYPKEQNHGQKFAPAAALPFFTLNSLPLVVAIALITESVITWLE